MARQRGRSSCTELEHGHDATAKALDEGLLAPAHAAVILRAGRHLPDGVTPQQREQVVAALVAQAQRFDPDQLRRLARRAIEAIEPDQDAVDAHEDQLLRTEEEAARDTCSLSFHDNDDGTTTGHFTIPTLAAAMLRKVIESMTAPLGRSPRRSRDVANGQGERSGGCAACDISAPLRLSRSASTATGATPVFSSPASEPTAEQACLKCRTPDQLG